MKSRWWPLITSVGVGTMTYLSMTRDMKSQTNEPVQDYNHYRIKGPDDTRNAN